MNKEDFINTVEPIIFNENKKRGYPLFVSVVLAQAICESGWGSSSIMMKANAIFGIKATSNWNGKVYNANTKECYNGSNYTDINACFRGYDSLEESITDYFDLICNNSRYAQALHSNDFYTCISAIKNGGYATSPTYIDTIIKIINDNNLSQYDYIDNQELAINNTQESQSIEYTVQPGDTLSAIAQKYNTTYQKIADDNGIENPNLIFPGQELTINNIQESQSIEYTVQSGDTLSAIAQKYNTTYQKIADDNGIENPNLIFPGQVIKIWA